MSPEGLTRLKADESCRLTAYPDPSSAYAMALELPEAHRPKNWAALSKTPWTCGYGCTGVDVVETTVWSQSRAEGELQTRVAEFEAALRHRLSWFADLEASSPARADVLVNIAFNIGVAGLMKWPVTLSDIAHGAYAKAASDIADNTKWRGQVHARSTRCADAMRTGAW